MRLGDITPGQLSATATTQADITMDDAASALLAMRKTLAVLWPTMKANASKLMPEDRKAWNDVQHRQIDIELKLYWELKKLGMSLPPPDQMQKTMQVGRFAEGLSGFGFLPLLGLAGWALAALGVTLATSVLALAAGYFMQSFRKAEILHAQAQLEAIRARVKGIDVPIPTPLPPLPFFGGLFGGVGIAVAAVAVGWFLLRR